jgi:hypothetical protein
MQRDGDTAAGAQEGGEMTQYCVTNGDGTTCRMGFSSLAAGRAAAQRIANQEGEPMWLTPEGEQGSDDGERFDPEAATE